MGTERTLQESAYRRLLEISYKKLKSSVFFDKTQLVLRDKIVQEEGRIERLIDSLTERLENNSLGEVTQPILQTLSILAFPKKMAEPDSETADRLISNAFTIK